MDSNKADKEIKSAECLFDGTFRNGMLSESRHYVCDLMREYHSQFNKVSEQSEVKDSLWNEIEEITRYYLEALKIIKEKNVDSHS